MIDVGWGVLHNDGDDFVAIGDDGKALKMNEEFLQENIGFRLAFDRGFPRRGEASKINPREVTNAPLSSAMKWIAMQNAGREDVKHYVPA